MSRLPPEDKGKIELPEWLTRVYADEVLRAVEAKKRETSKKSDETAPATFPRYAKCSRCKYISFYELGQN